MSDRADGTDVIRLVPRQEQDGVQDALLIASESLPNAATILELMPGVIESQGFMM